jgi:PAS domain S-box-containing protein
MRDQYKTKQKLIEELVSLRGQVTRLEKKEKNRKGTEEELRQAKAHTKSILDSVTDTYILFDYHWRYLYVNEPAISAIGWQREKILGRTLWELYPDIVGTELDRQYHRAMDERLPLTFDFHYATLNTWWENRFYPAPEGLAVFATNITERKKAEDALRESKERYKRLIEGSPAIVWSFSNKRGTTIKKDPCYQETS